MDHEHEWGPIEHAHFTGEPHRKCQVVTETANEGLVQCRSISLDLDEEDFTRVGPITVGWPDDIWNEVSA